MEKQVQSTSSNKAVHFLRMMPILLSNWQQTQCSIEETKGFKKAASALVAH